MWEKGRSLCIETENVEGVSSMAFPSTPNADNQILSFAAHGEGVPVVQWIPATQLSSESVTVLPAANWASAPLLRESESSPVAMPQQPQEAPQRSAPPPPSQQGTAGWAESLTVLPPAFWAPAPVSENESSATAVSPTLAALNSSTSGVLLTQISFQGPPQPPPQGVPPSAPPPISVTQESATVLPPAFWGPAASNLENDRSSMAIPAPQGPPQALQQGSTPPRPPALPAPPQFMPGTHVLLQGLAHQPDFNGLSGIVSAFDVSCGRYNVLIEIGPDRPRQMVKVKFQNLLLAVPPCATSPALQQAVISCPPCKASLVLDQMV